MVFGCIVFRKQNRIIPPNDSLRADFLRQLLKGRNYIVLFIRQSTLNIGAISRQCKLEIISIRPQRVQFHKHRFGIFGPKHNAVHHLGRQRNFADLTRVHRVADIHISFLYSIQKPVGIVIRNIRPAACTQYHRTVLSKKYTATYVHYIKYPLCGQS